MSAVTEIARALDEARGHLGDCEDTRSSRAAKAAVNKAALLLARLGVDDA